MSVVDVNMQELKKLELALLRSNKVGFKIATEQTLNDLAFEARTQAREQIERSMTVRNKWTLAPRNNPIDKAKRGKPFAEFGSTLGYMAKQEEGFISQPDRFTGAVAIPTPVASGERKGGAQGKTIRRKPVRKPNRRNMLKMPSKRMKELPRRERNAALIQEAIKSKRRFIELERNGETNIFRVKGNKKRYQLDRLYKTEHRAVISKPKPWLAPATKKAYEQAPRFYMNRLDYQIKRMMRK